VTVQEKGGSTLRIYFTNVRCPKYNWALAEKNLPWAFDAREFTRSSLAKKKVTLELDVRKIVVKEEPEKKEIEINSGTIFIKDKPFCYDLLLKGYGELKVVKGSEDISSAIKSYSLAVEKAQKAKSGIHGKKYVSKSYWDYSIPENKKKLASESNIEKGECDLPAIVEKCISASRFKLRLESKGCYIIFAIDTVTSIRSNKNMESLEKWAVKGTQKATELLAQCDVTVDIHKIDKAGTCHGALFLQNKNYGVKILSEGLAYLETSFGKSKNHVQYEAAQKKAQNAKKGFWKDESVLGCLGLIQEDDNQMSQSSGAREYTAELSECESALEFYIKRNDSSEMSSIVKNIKAKVSKCSVLNEPIELNTLCLANFHGEYHRARIVSKSGKNKFKVFYIDWGNTSLVNIHDLKICPNKIMNIKPQAICVRLAHIRVPSPEQNFGYNVIDLIQEKLYQKSFYVTELSRSNGVSDVEIHLSSKKEFESMLNYSLTQQGLALPDMDLKSVESDQKWKDAYVKAMDANPEILMVLDEYD
jgi:endonuclease YncB( thermonuclease family)